jgi:hypothetical protein
MSEMDSAESEADGHDELIDRLARELLDDYNNDQIAAVTFRSVMRRLEADREVSILTEALQDGLLEDLGLAVVRQFLGLVGEASEDTEQD